VAERPIALPPVWPRRKRVLTDMERYNRAFAQCTFNAGHAQHPELRGLWLTIASSYEFLLNREKRLEDEEATRRDQE
jgi:hypothetical protein